MAKAQIKELPVKVTPALAEQKGIEYYEKKKDVERLKRDLDTLHEFLERALLDLPDQKVDVGAVFLALTECGGNPVFSFDLEGAWKKCAEILKPYVKTERRLVVEPAQLKDLLPANEYSKLKPFITRTLSKRYNQLREKKKE